MGLLAYHTVQQSKMSLLLCRGGLPSTRPDACAIAGLSNVFCSCCRILVGASQSLAWLLSLFQPVRTSGRLLHRMVLRLLDLIPCKPRSAQTQHKISVHAILAAFCRPERSAGRPGTRPIIDTLSCTFDLELPVLCPVSRHQWAQMFARDEP